MARQGAFELKRPVGRPPFRKKGERNWKHKCRPQFTEREPLHVTLRVTGALRSLRRMDAYAALRAALVTIAKRERAFRIVHVSVQSDHVHLLVEAASQHELSRGMAAFQISAARRLNRVLAKREGYERRTGPVFRDRYHMRPLKSPTTVRHALAYVLSNWRKHGAHADDRRALDPFSTAHTFTGWREYRDTPPPPPRDPLPVSKPRTWLLSRGWSRVAAISAATVPSAPS